MELRGLLELLALTEEHVLAPFSYEETLDYRSRLRQLTAEILERHPEYQKEAEFGELLRTTDEYLQQETSHETEIQYCGKVSEHLWNLLGGWRIESISLAEASGLPTGREMEKLLPPGWPQGWHELNRSVQDGMVSVRLGHANPLSEEYRAHLKKVEEALLTIPPGVPIARWLQGIREDFKRLAWAELGEYDYQEDLAIAGHPDEKTARQFFESPQAIFVSGLDAPAPGTPVGISLGDLLQAFAPGKLTREVELALARAGQGLSQSGVKFEKGELLGEEAVYVVGQDGKRVCQGVLIGDYVIRSPMLGYSLLPPANTPTHSLSCLRARLAHAVPLFGHGWGEKRRPCECRSCRGHPECSTLGAEGLVHREMVEAILSDIFSRIKGEKGRAKQPAAEITRGSRPLTKPKGELRLGIGETIKTNRVTRVDISDGAGNQVSIGARTEAKIHSPSRFELLTGSITAFIKKLKPRTKFEVRTPTSAVSVRGTVFSLHVANRTTTLTVTDGEVEFSDHKGGKVIVQKNQVCVCSGDEGLQRPITLPPSLRALGRD